MIIGAGYYNVSDKGNSYIAITLDELIIKAYPGLENVKFSLLEIPENERVENSPGYRLSAYIPKAKEQ